MAIAPQDHVKPPTGTPPGRTASAQKDPFATELMRLPGKRGVAAILALGVTGLDALICAIRRMDTKPTLCCVAPSSADGERVRAAYPSDSHVLVIDYNDDRVGGVGAPDSARDRCSIEELARTAGVTHFDVVLIERSDLLQCFGIPEILRTAKWIAIDGITAAGKSELYAQLANGSVYEVYAQNLFIRQGYAIFRSRADKQANDVPLPVHFLTVAGEFEPFAQYHLDVLRQLPFEWTWHVVVRTQGHSTSSVDDDSANDVSRIAAEFPERVRLYRRGTGKAWIDDLEMANAPLTSIREDCLLWRIDPEELWTVDQIVTARNLFLDEPERTAAFYWCWYFVGGERVIISRNCHGQDPDIEWLRTWRYRPGDAWHRFDPPLLTRRGSDGLALDVGRHCPFTHAETEASGLVFQNLACATEEQARILGFAAGSPSAAQGWRDLQNARLPTELAAFFPWVGNGATVGLARWAGVSPLAKHGWSFSNKPGPERPLIVVDGVFFQRFSSGIARVWRSLLIEWARTDFSRDIVLLDRADTAPIIPGIKRITIPAHSYVELEKDRAMLQRVCDELRADLFISSYYTTPTATRCVVMAYDMIPEVLRFDMSNAMWLEKRHAVTQAHAFVAISNCSARDLFRFYPDTATRPITVAHCGVPDGYGATAPEKIQAVRNRYGIDRPFFLLSGGMGEYKNVILFFKAFARHPRRDEFAVVTTGPHPDLDPQYRPFVGNAPVHVLWLEDDELKALYSDALALVYPSLYEGFGLPIVEAMACGCPVITTPVASIPEVAGNAALYVQRFDTDAMLKALTMVEDPKLRAELSRRGREQIQKFSWKTMANKVRNALTQAASQPGVRPDQRMARSINVARALDHALVDLHANRPIAARTMCEWIAKTVPDNPYIHHVRGIALLRENKIQDSVEAFLKTLKCKPNYPAALNSLGVALHVNGSKTHAQRCFERALALDASHVQARRNLDLVKAEIMTEELALDMTIPDDALRASQHE